MTPRNFNPCPFCWEVSKLSVDSEDHSFVGTLIYFFVKCGTCEARGPVSKLSLPTQRMDYTRKSEAIDKAVELYNNTQGGN